MSENKKLYAIRAVAEDILSGIIVLEEHTGNYWKTQEEASDALLEIANRLDDHGYSVGLGADRLAFIVKCATGRGFAFTKGDTVSYHVVEAQVKALEWKRAGHH